MNMVNYVFDIDGTLTPARQRIEPKFEDFFVKWAKNKRVYFISGSDYPKSQEQIGDTLLQMVNGCFNTAGNVYYEKGRQIYRQDWDPPQDLISLLEQFLRESRYPIRTANHIERRIGMINFSVIGRACSREQRKDYSHYDSVEHERARFQSVVMDKFPDIEVSIGGQISIDIYPRGHNKSQIVNHINGPIHFFGDKTMPGGNDYDLAKVLQHPPHKVSQVENWEETMALLKNIP